MERLLRTVSVSFLFAAAPVLTFAEPIDDSPISDFQLVIRQSGGELAGVNFVFGRGEDVTFFSNIDEIGTWTESEGGIRVGTLNPGSENTSVIVGVCAGGECDVSEGISFTSRVGVGLDGN